MATKGRSSLSSHPLYGFNFLTKFTKRAELMNYLQELHEHLQSLDQDVQKAPRGLPTTISHLINPKVLESTDREISVITGCCIVDALRIYAPEAPYKDADMVRVYDMLIQHIRRLQIVDPSSDIGIKMVYILKSLANVKSCVVPVIMTQSNVPGAAQLVEGIFEAIVNAVRPEHDEEKILHACIEEFEGISEDLLDILLQPLLPSAKIENPTTFRVVAIVLRAVAPLIKKTVTDVLRDILIGSTSKLNGKLSEIAEDIYPLIYELHRIAPDIVSEVIPCLCMQLKVEEEDIRHNAVKLLCSLFISDLADYAKEFQRDFKEFLGRLNDLSLDIRFDVLNCCGVLLKNKPELTIVEEYVAKRLRDHDETIRSTALKKLLEYSHTHISTVSLQTINEIADRAKDKKFEVRKLSLEGLSKLYHRHISSKLLPISSVELDKDEGLEVALTSNILRSIMERLGTVPGVVMKAWGFPDMATKHLCVRLIQEYLIPKPIKAGVKNDNNELDENEETEDNLLNSEETSQERAIDEEEATQKSSKRSKSAKSSFNGKGSREKPTNPSVLNFDEESISLQRTTALLVLYISFDDADRSCFSSMIAFKAKAHHELNQFLNIKLSKGNETAHLSEGAVSAQQQHSSVIFQMKQALTSLTQHVPPMESKRTVVGMNTSASLFERLLGSKDRNIYKLIGCCLDSEDDIQQALIHRNDLQQRLDSKSPLGEYFGMVYDFAGNMICNSSIMESLLDLISTGFERLGHKDVAIVTEIIYSIVRFCPKLAKSCSKFFLRWLNHLRPQNSSSAATGKKGKQQQIVNKQLKPELFAHFYSSMICCSIHLDEADDEKVELASMVVELLNELEDPEQCYRLSELLCHLVFCSMENHDMNDKTSPTASSAASPVVVNYIRGICSKSSLNINHNNRIMQQLMSLVALMTIPTAMYESLTHLKVCTDRMLRALYSTLRNNLFEFLQFDVLQTSQERDIESIPMELKLVALKCWTMIICCDSENYIFRKLALKAQAENSNNKNNNTAITSKRGSTGGSSSSGATSSSSSEDLSATKPVINELLKVVFDCLQAHGSSLAGYNIIDSKDQEQAYFTASWCGVQLLRIRNIGDKVTPVQWQELGWSLIGVENRNLKRQLLLSLLSVIQTHPVDIKFLTYPCLFANDSVDHNSELAQRGLIFAIKRLRKTQDEIGTKVIQEEDEKRRSKYQKTATFTMPEMIMPYLLHLLSYSPDFPRSVALDNEDDKKRMKSVIKCVSCLLTSLQSTLRIETSNLPYLFKQLNTINRDYVDRLDYENIGLHFVTRLTVKMLNEQVKTAENLQVHPSEITLPSELYSPISSESVVRDAAGVKGRVQEGLEVAEQAINKILQITGKGRGGGVSKVIITSPVAVKRSRSPAISAEKGRPERRFSLEEDEEDHVSDKKKKTTKAPSKSTAPKLTKANTASLPAPSRVMPKRSAKGAAPSYVEKDENLEEVEEWDEQAGRSSTSSARRISAATISEVSPINGSASRRSSENWGSLDEEEDGPVGKLSGGKRKFSTSKGSEISSNHKVDPSNDNVTMKDKSFNNETTKGLRIQPPNQQLSDDYKKNKRQSKSIVPTEDAENLEPSKPIRKSRGGAI